MVNQGKPGEPRADSTSRSRRRRLGVAVMAGIGLVIGMFGVPGPVAVGQGPDETGGGGGGPIPGLPTLPFMTARASRPKVAVEVEPNIVYRTIGKYEFLADLHLPGTDGLRPAVLLIHGGGWSGGSKVEMGLIADALARRGFVVFNVNYRLSPPAVFPGHLDDCVAALRYLRDHAEAWRIDPDRVGVWGYSAGGHLALLLALAASDGDDDDGLPVTGRDRVAAAVGGGAVCDFEFLDLDSEVLKHVFGGSRRDKPDLYATATPGEHITGDAPPIFLYHGTQDRVVPIQSAKLFADELRAASVTVETLPLKGEGHIGAFFNSAGIRAGVDFLARRLQVDGPSETP